MSRKPYPSDPNHNSICMEANNNDKERSEPIRDIVGKMPTHFGRVISILVISLVLLLGLLAWFIRYPDTVAGEIVINAQYAPVKLVANSAGKITLLHFKPREEVRQGDYIAVIQNSANLTDMQQVKELLARLDLYAPACEKNFLLFPPRVSLGDVNLKYYTFLNDFQQFYEYKKNNVFQKQEENLKTDITRLSAILANNNVLEQTHLKNMTLAKKFSYRDSILLAEKIATEDELDQSNINYLTSKQNYQNAVNNIISTQQQIEDDESKLQQQVIQRNDKERQLLLDLRSAFNDLKDNINTWELQYVFKSPMDGKVDFLKFLTDGEFTQAGEELFGIVPRQNKLVGQVQLPSTGAGKVRPGQEVIIKLDNYPYEEYGSITGIVSSISLMSNMSNKDRSAGQTEVSNYLVEVDLPKDLTTNYGKKLEFKFGIKGTADIVCMDKKLIQRFFDNLQSRATK
jgi:multidrug efflux pump subunit AcrA (membrane-fusion protein)